LPIVYVLVNTEMGLEFDVARELRKIEGVEEVSPVYGSYDLVVRLSSESLEDLRRIITWQIRKLNSITATLTHLIHEKADNSADQAMESFIVSMQT
jgi:DNA-binding Lrp family transcriptional regulator